MREYYKIGELSKLFDISTDTLRYYENIGVLVPQRAENNYRVYRAGDIWKLNVIRDLRDLGFPMETICDYLASRSISSTLQIIDEELATIESTLRKLQQIESNLRLRKEAICAAQREPTETIKQCFLPARPCHRIMQSYENDVEMDLLMKKLINFDKEKLYIVGNTQMGSFISLSNVAEGRFTSYDSVFVLHENGEYQIPAGDYLVLCYHGDCGQNARYIPQLLDYASRHQLRCCGPVLEITWVDIHTSQYLEEQIIQLQLRVCADADAPAPAAAPKPADALSEPPAFPRAAKHRTPPE